MATNLNSLLGGGGGGGAGWKPESKQQISYANSTGLKANVTAPTEKLIKITYIGNADDRANFHPVIALVVNGVNIKTGATWSPDQYGTNRGGTINNGHGGDRTGFDTFRGPGYNEIFCTTFTVTVTAVASAGSGGTIVYEIGEFI